MQSKKRLSFFILIICMNGTVFANLSLRFLHSISFYSVIVEMPAFCYHPTSRGRLKLSAPHKVTAIQIRKFQVECFPVLKPNCKYSIVFCKGVCLYSRVCLAQAFVGSSKALLGPGILCIPNQLMAEITLSKDYQILVSRNPCSILRI
eukprot:c22333_g1_i1 orf=330-773(+)